MEYNLLTREECQNILSTIDENTGKPIETFYVSKREFKGFEIEMYDYRLASYKDFFPENEGNRTELRGYTFILNPETKEWERHIALQKFFNINQTTDWMEEDVKDKTVVSFSDKRDGSLILPVKLPNGEIVMKTKMSFVSEQAVAAQSIYDENKNYQGFIKYCEEENIQTMWEYTAFDNQIVLAYNERELFLLQARYKDTGQYLTQARLTTIANSFNIPITKQYDVSNLHINKSLDYMKEVIGDFKFDTLSDMINYLYDHNYLVNDVNEVVTKTLDFLLFARDYIEKEEGVVLTFDDGQMGKIKHTKYFQMHGLVTEGTRENLLIQTIIEDNIDDVLAQILPGEKRDFIMEVTNKVMKKFNHSIVEIKERLDTFDDYDNRGDFARSIANFEYKGVVFSSLNDRTEKNVEKNLKEYILKMTNGLDKARLWLKNIE